MNKFSILFLVILLSSCASEKPKGKTAAEILFKEAKVLMEEERYLLATEKLNNLKNQYPYSYYATPAELLQADILYLQESYVEAAASYLLFRDFHPKHEQIAYVIFKIAESFFKQLPETFDRDLDSAVEAIKYYNELSSKFPKSKYSKDAQKNIAKARQMLQSKEKYIADFYFKTEVYGAARWRYLDIIGKFENKKLKSHSIQRVIMSSFYLKEYEKCLDYSRQFFGSLNPEFREKTSDYIANCKNKI